MADIFNSDIIKVKAKPNSKKTEIRGIENNTINLDVKAPPEGNKANIEILKFIQKLTGKKARIIKGRTSKQKIIKLES